ncbi:S1 family peptidase [Actinoplanes sp. NPDC051851]|uniref:S1 family peptidase n=1 Tax=Actinoplanes sp. NPDC051851 TaxID=3154753 RepID=UPI003445B25C
MRTTPLSGRRRMITLIAPAVLLGAFLASPAQATPGAAADAAATRATALSEKLGTGATAGAYYDSATGSMVVTVTTAAAAAKVRAIGAVAKLVRNSGADLDAAMDTVEAAAAPGTSWATDTVANQVVVTVDSTVTGAKLAALRAAVAATRGAARLEQVDGTVSPLIAGGEAIYGGSYRCSLGFNVKSGSTYYFITAGHCADVATTWYSNSAKTTLLGTNYDYSFPGDDYGVVQYTNSSVAHPSSVYTYSGSQTISSIGSAYVGESVSRSGSTTGVHTGSVTALDARVYYAGDGIVRGLIKTDVCAESGDSGGSLYSGSIALGITSGGSGDCDSGGITYFQPVDEVADLFGLTLP